MDFSDRTGCSRSKGVDLIFSHLSVSTIWLCVALILPLLGKEGALILPLMAKVADDRRVGLEAPWTE